VRFLSNRSSGKMAYAIADAAIAAGHEVVLVSGPVCLTKPAGLAEFAPVVSAEDMYLAVEERICAVDVAIMAAAVADYRPAAVADQKIKKTGETLTLELERTRDILGSAREKMGFKGILAGFAAETENVRTNAIGKMQRKGCDLLFANDVSQPDVGFDTANNEITVYFADGREMPLDKDAKSRLGARLIEIIESLLPKKS
jgi:phosphopantothenoylcysteine synthetase/decarboxylase